MINNIRKYIDEIQDLEIESDLKNNYAIRFINTTEKKLFDIVKRAIIELEDENDLVNFLYYAKVYHATIVERIIVIRLESYENLFIDIDDNDFLKVENSKFNNLKKDSDSFYNYGFKNLFTVKRILKLFNEMLKSSLNIHREFNLNEIIQHNEILGIQYDDEIYNKQFEKYDAEFFNEYKSFIEENDYLSKANDHINNLFITNNYECFDVFYLIDKIYKELYDYELSYIFGGEFDLNEFIIKSIEEFMSEISKLNRYEEFMSEISKLNRDEEDDVEDDDEYQKYKIYFRDFTVQAGIFIIKLRIISDMDNTIAVYKFDKEIFNTFENSKFDKDNILTYVNLLIDSSIEYEENNIAPANLFCFNNLLKKDIPDEFISKLDDYYNDTDTDTNTDTDTDTDTNTDTDTDTDTDTNTDTDTDADTNYNDNERNLFDIYYLEEAVLLNENYVLANVFLFIHYARKTFLDEVEIEKSEYFEQMYEYWLKLPNEYKEFILNSDDAKQIKCLPYIYFASQNELAVKNIKENFNKISKKVNGDETNFSRKIYEKILKLRNNKQYENTPFLSDKIYTYNDINYEFVKFLNPTTNPIIPFIIPLLLRNNTSQAIDELKAQQLSFKYKNSKIKVNDVCYSSKDNTNPDYSKADYTRISNLILDTPEKQEDFNNILNSISEKLPEKTKDNVKIIEYVLFNPDFESDIKNIFEYYNKYELNDVIDAEQNTINCIDTFKEFYANYEFQFNFEKLFLNLTYLSNEDFDISELISNKHQSLNMYATNKDIIFNRLNIPVYIETTKKDFVNIFNLIEKNVELDKKNNELDEKNAQLELERTQKKELIDFNIHNFKHVVYPTIVSDIAKSLKQIDSSNMSTREMSAKLFQAHTSQLFLINSFKLLEIQYNNNDAEVRYSIKASVVSKSVSEARNIKYIFNFSLNIILCKLWLDSSDKNNVKHFDKDYDILKDSFIQSIIDEKDAIDWFSDEIYPINITNEWEDFHTKEDDSIAFNLLVNIFINLINNAINWGVKSKNGMINLNFEQGEEYFTLKMGNPIDRESAFMDTENKGFNYIKSYVSKFNEQNFECVTFSEIDNYFEVDIKFESILMKRKSRNEMPEKE